MFNNWTTNSNAGWIGIDRGARALKLAQLRRVGQGLELSAMAITPRWNAAEGAFEQGEQCRREVETACKLVGTCSGRQAAAIASMSVCTIDTDDNLAQATMTGNCLDLWQASPNSSYTLSLPETAVNDLCHGIEQAGLQCSVVDGLPLALARALTLAPRYRPDELVAALDWGASSATLIVAKGGHNIYARKLNRGDFGSVLESLAPSLQLLENEVEKVAISYGVSNGNADVSDPVAKSVSGVLTQAAMTLVDEMQSTFSHLEGKLKTRRPERLWVFGMGATIPGLPEWLGEKCNVQAAAWRPEGIVLDDSQGAPPCLFGPAIALSALAWNARGSQQ